MNDDDLITLIGEAMWRGGMAEDYDDCDLDWDQHPHPKKYAIAILGAIKAKGLHIGPAPIVQARTLLDQVYTMGESYNASVKAGKCGCWACADARMETPTVFVVCKKCGNKRCPHCSNHRFLCTGSNEPGQVGVIDPDAE